MADDSPRLPSVMSLRDYFAGQALAGLLTYLSSVDWKNGAFGRAELYAKAAYETADAMLTERERDTR